jgi:hypothetical protein
LEFDQFLIKKKCIVGILCEFKFGILMVIIIIKQSQNSSESNGKRGREILKSSKTEKKQTFVHGSLEAILGLTKMTTKSEAGFEG